MIETKWEGVEGFKRRLVAMRRRVWPEVDVLLRGVSEASAQAAAKASRPHRKSGRLQSSIAPVTTPTTAGFTARYYVRANRALGDIRKSAEAAAEREVEQGSAKFLRRLTKK